MINQKCAICKTNNFTIVYKANFDIDKINENTFSARRLPDRIHYQIVKCKKCSLIYSNPILPPDQIEKLYKKSFTRYDDLFINLNETYGHYLKKLDKYHAKKNRLLEIGCGSGFFLEEAKRQGYKNVHGVEPGKKSVAIANKSIKPNIIIDIFKANLYKKNYFDVICCFQTFDHIANPNDLLKECYKILKPKGIVLFYNHDVESISAKILKEKSPIIDIEHTYLYNKKTITQIFKKNKFSVLKVDNAFTIHKLSYWLFLFPLPQKIKKYILKLLKFFKIDNKSIKINPGNLYIIARK